MYGSLECSDLKFITRSSWSFVDRMAAICLALGIMFFFASPNFGYLEGVLFPVVKDFEVSKSSSVSRIETRIWGSFEIVRPSCNFHAIEWYVVGPTRETHIDIEFEEGNKVRDGGINTFGPWVVDVSQNGLPKTRADVFHQCPYRPWYTVTPLFP